MDLPLNNNKIKKRSSYILQLKNFEDRFKSKGLKTKFNSLMLRKPSMNSNCMMEDDVTEIAKQICSKKFDGKNFFQIDKENCWDPEINIERRNQNFLLNKIRRKLYEAKDKKMKFSDNNSDTSSVNTISRFNIRSRVKSESQSVPREVRLRKFANDVSFIKYKKNKNMYSVNL